MPDSEFVDFSLSEYVYQHVRCAETEIVDSRM